MARGWETKDRGDSGAAMTGTEVTGAEVVGAEMTRDRRD